jgi:hypothetical protein
VKVSIRFRNVLLTSIAAGAGLLTLLGYFIPVPLLLAVRMQLVSWATLLAAIAVLIGAYSLIKAHLRNFMSFKTGGAYSLVAVLGFVAMLIAGIVTPDRRHPGQRLPPRSCRAGRGPQRSAPCSCSSWYSQPRGCCGARPR